MSFDVLVDLGRSHVRVVAPDVDSRMDGGAGLVDAGGPDGAARLVANAVRTAVVPSTPWRLAVCAPGVVTAPELAARFADALAAAFDTTAADVLVASDSAAWQVGAFAGGEGAVVALGTGAVVTARIADRVVRLDGKGLLLGDVGGGGWIGLQALRAANNGRSELLRTVALKRFGPQESWPGLQSDPQLASRLAAFVPDVAAAADQRDEAAIGALDDAARQVAGTLSALPPGTALCLVGGVAELLSTRLRALVPEVWQAPRGDAVDGLRHLLDDPGPAYADELFHGHSAAAGGHDTDRLPTEQVAPDTADLDTWSTQRLVARLAAGHRIAARAVLDASKPLAAAADLAGAALRGSGRLVYVGAGTPGRLAVQDAAELTPTFGLDPSRAIVLLAGGAAAGRRAIEGAEDDTTAAASDVDAAHVGSADVVVGISASGRTPYVIAALRRAAERGATTVGIGNVAGSELSAAAGVAVELLTGPEVLAGSTRLAAGTAQKIALNTLSTAAMIRAGSTYGPWMVDMLATNEKLRRRAVRMVREIAQVSEDEAEATLAAADRSLPVALVMLLAGDTASEARRALADSGSVRAAVRRAGAS